MYDNTLKEVFSMKKNKISLITLITSTALLIACSNNALTSNNNVSSSTLNSSSNESIVPSSQSSEGEDIISVSSVPVSSISDSNNYGGDNSSTSSPISSESSSETPSSSAPSSSSSSDAGSNSSSSSDSGSTSSQPIDVNDDTLDGDIEKFLDDLNIYIPSLNEYDLEHLVIYYYAYESYMIVAYGEDLDGSIESAYASKVDTESTLISQNDDDYPVEYYGYIYSDEEQNIVLGFYTDDGLFYLSLTRYDGLHGSLDVSDVDTNWYVDYINFQGMELVSEIPLADIKEYLGLDNLVLPAFIGNAFLIYFEEAYVNDDDEYVPDTFYVILEGDQIENCINLLKLAGFTAELVENTGYDIDWDTYELIEYTYYTGVAYDTDKTVYITISTDESVNTLISFNNYEDLFCKNVTNNTDWTDDEKALMSEVLGYVLPFMALGEDYEVIDWSDEEWDCLYLKDSYSEDLSEQYIEVLLDNGFKVDDYEGEVYYTYDNGTYFIEVFVGYNGGNWLEVYSEESHLAPLTALALNETSLDIVAGASFQLEPAYTPSDATHPLTWSSSNEEIATVDNKGLVTIKETAAVDTSVVITASAANGVSASCTFNVVPDLVTALEFTQESYVIVPNGQTIVTEYRTLPIGASFNGRVSYGFERDGTDLTGIHYDGDGNLYADETAIPGTTFTIFIRCGSLICYATVTVASAEVTHTLTRDFSGIEKANYSKYQSYSKTTDDGAVYEAYCAGNSGIQLRSKSSDSGVIGHFEGRTCKSITFTFDESTAAGTAERGIEIYASNSPFTIEDMFDSSLTKVGTITFDQNNLTQTYTFTSDYAYIGFRSINGAVYLPSIEIVW